MAQTVKPIPDGYSAVTPYLIVNGGAKALAFYAKAFDAHEVMRIGAPGDKIGHAEIEIGGARIMLADEFPERGIRGPKSVGGSPVTIHLYVENSDKTYAAAVAAGATGKEPVQDKFYGDRSGIVVDPFGHEWNLATHVEDVGPEELKRRMDKLGMT